MGDESVEVRVFDMLVERLTNLEETAALLMDHLRYQEEVAPKGREVSPAMLGRRDGRSLLKRFDGALHAGNYVVVDTGFDVPAIECEAWARNEERSWADDAVESALGRGVHAAAPGGGSGRVLEDQGERRGLGLGPRAVRGVVREGGAAQGAVGGVCVRNADREDQDGRGGPEVADGHAKQRHGMDGPRPEADGRVQDPAGVRAAREVVRL